MRFRLLALLAMLTFIVSAAAGANASSPGNAVAGSPPAAHNACGEFGSPIRDAAFAPRLPDGLRLHLLAYGYAEVPELGSEGDYNTFELSRFELEPNTDAGVQAGNFSGPGLLYAESGAVTVRLPSDSEVLLCSGSQMPLDAWSDYEVSNDGSQTARLLRLRYGLEILTGAYASAASLQKAGLIAAPLTDGGYTAETLDPGVTYHRLVVVDFHLAVPTAAQLFIAETSWEPGTSFDGWFFCGPVGMAVEGGVLTGQEPPHTNEAPYPQGHFVFYPPDDDVMLRNSDADPASVIMAGVLPRDQPPAMPSRPCGTGT